MGFEIQKKDKQSVFKIDKELTIAEVTSLKDNIVKEMPSSEAVVIDLEGVERLDIAGLQLLCAANRSFEKQKKIFTVQTGGNNEFFRNFMIQAGYDSSGSCHESSCNRCLWKGDGKGHGKKDTDS